MTVYYVDTAVGADINAGTSEGSGNAWATIDHAMNTVVAGDKVWVKASGTYSETPNIDTAGTAALRTVFEGYTSSTGDNGRVTIAGSTNCLTQSINAPLYYIFKNFVFSGASSDGVEFGTSADDAEFYNCQFTNNGGFGMQGDNNFLFVNCELSNNTGGPVDIDNNGKFIACEIFGNGNEPVSNTGQYFFCLVHDTANGQPALNQPGNLINCTIDGNSTSVDLITAPSAFSNTVLNNIFLDTDVNGYDNSSAFSTIGFAGYNLFYNITGSNYNTAGAAKPETGYGDAANADPSFTDRAGDDYTLGDASPAIDAGTQPGLL